MWEMAKQEIFRLLTHRWFVLYTIVFAISVVFTFTVGVVGVFSSLHRKETVADDLSLTFKRLLSLIYYAIFSFGVFLLTTEKFIVYLLFTPLFLHILYEFNNLGNILGDGSVFLFKLSKDAFKILYDKFIKKLKGDNNTTTYNDE